MLTYTEIIKPTDERLGRILGVAKKHFTAYGFRRASISDICTEAGISKPTFYKYFAKKETLFFATVIYLGRDFAETYEKRVAGIDNTSDKLKIFLETSEEFTLSNPLLLELWRNNPELRSDWAGSNLSSESYLHMVDFTEQILLEGIAKDEFRTRDPRRAAHVIVLASMLFVIFEPQMPGLDSSTESNSRFLYELLKNGITT